MTDQQSAPTATAEDSVCSSGELPPKKPPHSIRLAFPPAPPARASTLEEELLTGLPTEKPEIKEHLGKVARMSRRQLQSLWRELFPTPAHPKLSRSLLVSLLSYRLQEELFGGLSSLIRARLQAIRGSQGGRSNQRPGRRSVSSTQTGPSMINLRHKKPPTRVLLNPGTRLLREWRGDTYTVLVVENGYQFQDSHYRSLSEIARRITGSRWSGPLFFGLKQGSAKQNPSSPSEVGQ